MRKATYIALFVLLLSLTLVSMDTRSFCWNLLDLFNDTVYSEEGLQKAIEYEPYMDHFFLPSIEGKDLFASIDDLSICRREEVRRYLYMYLTVGREYVKNSIHRSYMYMEIIEDVMEEYPEIPRDMALLPLLESGFNPRAVSKSRAVGLWQFMYPTSQMLGLKINNWVDERRHIEKSTRAALRHLKNLYSIYGSWELSLAAYNGGAGHVSRTMKRTGIRDYWKLADSGQLRNETSEYVARYAALVLIYKNRELFNIGRDLKNIPKTVETENMLLKYPVNIHSFSKITGISIKTIKQLNPELKRNVTPPYTKKYSLRVPSEKKKDIEKDKKKLYKIRFSGIKKHTVKRGECLSSIARRYKTRLSHIIFLNDIKNPHLIKPGKKLYIPI